MVKVTFVIMTIMCIVDILVLSTPVYGGTIIPANTGTLAPNGDPQVREHTWMISGNGHVWGGTGIQPTAGILAFQLPDLGMQENPFLTAQLRVTIGDLLDADGTGSMQYVDLYGLPRRTSDALDMDLYYRGGWDPNPAGVNPASGTGLTAEWFFNDIGDGTYTTVGGIGSGATILADYLNAEYAGGSGIGQYVFLRLNTREGTIRGWVQLNSSSVQELEYVERTMNNVNLTINTIPADMDTVTPSAGTYLYTQGDVVDLSAARYVNCLDVYVFDHWSGDVADPNSANTTVLMDADKTVTAVFEDDRRCGDECHPVPPYDLSDPKDCKVDLDDLAILIADWLLCTAPGCEWASVRSLFLFQPYLRQRSM